MRPALAIIVALLPGPALGHAAEGGFVLLLPTAGYIAAGVVTVAATVALVALLPGAAIEALFAARALGRSRRLPGRALAGALAFAAVPLLVVAGFLGPHDPQRNPLPLAVWSVLWLILPVAHALCGNLWRALNPWHWPASLARRAGLRPRLRIPAELGHAIGFASFLAFAALLLAHPAPTDPERLAPIVAAYWSFHFLGTLLCGPRWLRRAEGFSLIFAAYATLAPVARAGGSWRIGLPGWQLLRRKAPPPGLALLMVALLATGSFDGLNETFFWISALGLNPLEFPGRSAVVAPSLAGLFIAVPALAAAFLATVALGLGLAKAETRPGAGFAALAPALLPIAIGYHIGHYLPSALIELQYLARAAAVALGMGEVHVSTGVFNTLATVRVIWLGQAGAVVAGHVLAVLLGHALAQRALGARATLSHLPLAAFMVGYTLFGLWLLAAPRGA